MPAFNPDRQVNGSWAPVIGLIPPQASGLGWKQREVVHSINDEPYLSSPSRSLKKILKLIYYSFVYSLF